MLSSEIKILQVNLNHCVNATEELVRFAREQHVDICLVQEPYIGRNFVYDRSIQNFHSANSNYKASILIFNPLLKGVLFKDLTNTHCVVVKVSNSSETTFCSIYSPPGGSLNSAVNSLHTLLDHLTNVAKVRFAELLIGGDFNAKNKEWNSDKNDYRGSIVMDWASITNLTLLNSGSDPTFSCTRGINTFTSHIDLTFSSMALLNKITGWKVLKNDTMSDHKYIEIRIGIALKRINRTTARYPIPMVLRGEFQHHLSSALQSCKQLYNPIDSANSLIRRTEVITKLVQSIAMKYKRNVPPYRKKRDLWWTSALEERRRYVKLLKRRLNSAKSQNSKINLWIQLFVHKKAYRSEIFKAKTSYWRAFCQETTSSNYHSTLGKIMKRSSTALPMNYAISGDSIALQLNSISQNLLDHHFPTSNFRTVPDQLSCDYSSPLPSPFSLEEVSDAIMSFSRKKAPGHDGLTVEMIQNHAIFTPLTIIYNSCLEFGLFPDTWKHAVVKVIPKPGKEDYSDPKSYRPIGLLDVMGKVLEKLLVRRIMHSVNSSLSNLQFGFTPGVSSTDALTRIIQQLVKRKKSGAAILISLDIQGAFDNLQWDSIIEQFKALRINSNYLRIIKSYLRDRSAELWTDIATSSKSISQGCVQGSVFGPSMWNVVLNSLICDLQSCPVHVTCYADDVTLVFLSSKGNDIGEQISATLRIVEEWGIKHRLSFSPSKTHIMAVGNERIAPTVTFGGSELLYCQKVKILGVTIDRKLSFDSHASEVIKKAYVTLRNIKRISGTSWGSSIDTLKLVYKSVIEKILIYASPAWSKYACCAAWKKLHQFQRRCILAYLKGYKTTSYYSCFVLSGEMEIKKLMEQESRIYNALKSNSTKWEHQKIETEYSLPSPEIRRTVKFNMQYSISDGIEIFTDGSKIQKDNGSKTVGSAFVALRNGTVLKESMFKLLPDCSVYQAELVAIVNALEFAYKENFSDVSVVTDSLSSLLSCANRSHKNPLVQRIQSVYHQLCEKQVLVKLFWIKAHAGHSGNEHADKLAKLAGISGQHYFTLPPISWVKREIKRKVFLEWCNSAKSWIKTNNPHRTITKFLASPVESIFLKRFCWTACHTWLISGHGPFNSYLLRFNLKDDEFCEFCNSNKPQSSEHLLFECSSSSLVRSRKAIAEHNVRWNKPPDLIIGAIKCPQAIDALIEQIHWLFQERSERSSSGSAILLPVPTVPVC